MSKVILIVVDNPAHRVMFNRYLQKAPHHLVFSTDGEDGYDRFLEVKPSLIIAHINVARLDGTILCQLVRQQPGGGNVPFVLIGDEASDAERVKKRVEAVGADRFLPLPFSARLLLDCITPMLETGRPHSIQAIVDPPTLPLPQSDLTLSPVGGVDFTDRSDASLLLGGPLPASVHESGDLPVPMIPTETPDMDTVVSFKNPFFDPPEPMAETVKGPELGIPPARAVTLPSVMPRLGSDSPITQLHDETSSPSLVAPMIPESDPMSSGQRVASLDGLAENTSQPTIGRSPVPRINTLDAVPTIEPGLPPPSVSSIEEPPIPGGVSRDIPDKDLSTQSRLLQEPTINPGTNPGKRDGAESEISSKQRLIQELPLVERTPTGDRSGAKVGLPAANVPAAGAGPNAGAAVRRGLDESQLGKRLAKRVRTMHKLLEEVDYYQLLGVEPGASLTQLRSSYFDLSLEFHPDRFFLLRSGELKEKIYAIYRKLSEAYRTLADEASRKSYDQARASRSGGVEPIKMQPKPAATHAASAELGLSSSVNKATPLADLSATAFQAGDMNGARLYLNLALQYDPKNASYVSALEKILSRLGPSL